MGYSNGLLESDEKGGSGERGEQGLPGIGFKLTDDGNFDIDGKRLTDVSQPVDGRDATTKAYVDGEIGHHTGNFYHLRQSFTFYDSSGTELALSTDSITGLVTDYKHGYYKIPKSGDDNYFSTLDIKIRNNLPQSTYSALFYLYGYRNNSIMSGVDLGPILFGVDGTNYNILKYDDDDSTQTRNHTKGIIWFTSDGSAGSIELGSRFFDKSITHFVILSRCVEGKVNLGFSSNIFNVSSTVGDVTLYFEDINMNSRKIKNLGGRRDDGDAINKKYLEDVALTLDGSNVMTGDLRMGQKKIVGLANPTGDGQATNKKYVDTENAKQDIAINDKTSKSYVDGEIAKVHIDTTPLLPRDGSRSMFGDLDMGTNNILKVENLTDYKDTDPYDYRVKDVKSVVNKEYLNEKFLKKDKDDNNFDLRGNIVINCEPYYDGLFTDNDLVSKKYVQVENAKQDIAINNISSISSYNRNLITALQTSKADQSYVDDNFLNLDGSKSMTGNLNTDGNYIDGLPELVEDDTSDETLAKIKGRAIDFGYYKKQRDYLVRRMAEEDGDLLPKDGSEPMGGNLNMTDSGGNKHSIVGLKDPQPSDSSYAASVNFVNNTVNGIIDKKIQESEERSIQAVQQENVFEKVMVDDLFILDDDDIHKVAVVDKDFHKINQQTYQFKIDYDSSIGYYSTRLGVNVVYLPIGYYTIVFEMYFSDKIDQDKITINASSGTLSVSKINTKLSSDHTRSVINFYKAMIHPSDDELDIDIALKNKAGQSYEADTQIFVVVYGVAGTQNDVDTRLWDRYFYVDDKKIHFEAPIDMVNKDIENVNDLSINNELNMNNRQIKNLGVGNEDSDGVNVKQLNEMETNVTNYVTGEFGKVNPVLKNNSDLIKFIYRNLIRNDSKLFLIKELYFPDSVEGRTQNNYSYQTNGDNKGEVTFYLTFVHKATTSDSMIITIHWFGGILSIYIFISKDRLVVSKNLLINESSLKSYNIPSYFKGKYLYLWIRIQNNVIKINFSGSKTISATHPNIQNKDENLSIIYVSDSPFTIQRGLITKNNYNQNSDAYKDIREYEISEGTFIDAS